MRYLKSWRHWLRRPWSFEVWRRVVCLILSLRTFRRNCLLHIFHFAINEAWKIILKDMSHYVTHTHTHAHTQTHTHTHTHWRRTEPFPMVLLLVRNTYRAFRRLVQLASSGGHKNCDFFFCFVLRLDFCNLYPLLVSASVWKEHHIILRPYSFHIQNAKNNFNSPPE